MHVDSDSLVTRRTANQLAEDAADADGVLDLAGVEFVSRAATDELLAHEHISDIELNLDDVDEHVQQMFAAVRKGREDHDPSVGT